MNFFLSEVLPYFVKRFFFYQRTPIKVYKINNSRGRYAFNFNGNNFAIVSVTRFCNKALFSTSLTIVHLSRLQVVREKLFFFNKLVKIVPTNTSSQYRTVFIGKFPKSFHILFSYQFVFDLFDELLARCIHCVGVSGSNISSPGRMRLLW